MGGTEVSDYCEICEDQPACVDMEIDGELQRLCGQCAMDVCPPQHTAELGLMLAGYRVILQERTVFGGVRYRGIA